MSRDADARPAGASGARLPRPDGPGVSGARLPRPDGIGGPGGRPEPRATYRVQLHAGFDFAAAAGLADYLAALGVSHLYASPALQAMPGSAHGYDVVDPRWVSGELGGEAGLARLRAALAGRGLGELLDIVPNHMAIAGRENAWWWDVLENGPASPYAAYFDVDWRPPQPELRDTVLLPILGEHYGRALEQGRIRLARAEGSFTLGYFDHELPVAPRSLADVLGRAAERTASDELAFLAGSFARLPVPTETDPERLRRLHRDQEVLRGLLAGLCGRDALVARAIDAVVAEVNASLEQLDALLDGQNYRLMYWRSAQGELDYRRFFDINTLVGVRVEDERVFEDTHALVLRWLGDGTLDGVRIDHVDGLRDPEMYLGRLRRAAPGAWIVVEKIVLPGEQMPASWPVAGTTGYDFLNVAGGLFVDPAGEGSLTELYAEFTGEPTDYGALVRETKAQALREGLASDVNRLTERWLEVCAQHPRYRDYARHELREVLTEVAARFPVYRTYVRPETEAVREEDAAAVRATLAEVRERRPDLDGDLVAFLEDLWLLRVRGEREADLVARLQQLTPPAMAKGAEDTAFYRYNRLVALNEVGGDPARFGRSVEDLHAWCADAQERWPQTLLASATHDTKRGEDVRARLALLSEMPARWAETVRRWAARNERHWHAPRRARRGRGPGLPDRNAEYLFYQTVVGAWPLDAERATAYMRKAAREAKQRTSWVTPDEEYEGALRTFVEGALGDAGFAGEVEAFVAGLRTPGWINGLAQTLLKLTAPGVPDLYQGTELWDLSLVDPDNRRPVDYAARRALLAELEGLAPEAIWARRDEGLPKLWLIRRALGLRARRPELFGAASTYAPLRARGARAAHVVAFARGPVGIQAVALAPRLVLGLAGDWGDTMVEIPVGRWVDVLTGDRLEGGAVALGAALRRFPVALLEREGGA